MCYPVETTASLDKDEEFCYRILSCDINYSSEIDCIPGEPLDELPTSSLGWVMRRPSSVLFTFLRTVPKIRKALNLRKTVKILDTTFGNLNLESAVPLASPNSANELGMV